MPLSRSAQCASVSTGLQEGRDPPIVSFACELTFPVTEVVARTSPVACELRLTTAAAAARPSSRLRDWLDPSTRSDWAVPLAVTLLY